MSDFIGKSGNKIYIMNDTFREGYCFNSFGEGIDRLDYSMSIVLSKYINKVELISIIGEPNLNICEIYYNGKVAVVNKKYLDVYYILRCNEISEVFVPLRVVHDTCAIQVLIPFRYKSIDVSYIENKLGKLSWSTIR